jgi:hypothetical protein
MSGPLIVSQATPELRNAFPGWILPTHCYLRAAITASGATVTHDTARTTQGVRLAQAVGGLYSLSFTKCRRVGAFHGNCSPAAGLGTPDNFRYPVFVYSAGDANAQAGLISVVFLSFAATPDDAAPVDNSQVAIDFWVDLG